MFKFSKSGAMVAAVALVCGVAGVARADDVVSYYTTGTFDTTAANWGTFVTHSGSGAALSSIFGVDSKGESVSLTYLGQASSGTPQNETVVGPGTFVSGPGGWIHFMAPMGDFKITTSGASGINSGSATATGINFTLNIFQTSPTPAGSDSLVGQVVFFGVTVKAGSAEVDFSSDSVGIVGTSTPPVIYLLNQTLYDVSTTGDGTSTTPVTADILVFGPGGAPPPAPLPSVASMGMTMLGLALCGLAGRKLTRRAAIA